MRSWFRLLLGSRPSTLVTCLVREPLVHFLLIGAGLFLLFGWRGNPASVAGGKGAMPAAEIVVTQADIDQMNTQFARTWQRLPTEQEQKQLIEDFIRSEIYYREAIAIGLDRDDAVLKRRLRQKMEFIFEDITSMAEPNDEELRAFMNKNQEKHLADPQVSFRHVYINADKRKKEAGAYAEQVLAELNRGASPDTVGDPFLLGPDVQLSPLWEIKNQFGEGFGKSLAGLAQGRWEGPVKSGFGLHLVYITKRTGGRLPELKEVRETVKRDWMFERQKELKDASYAKLKEKYIVEIEQPKDVSTASTTETGKKVVSQ